MNEQFKTWSIYVLIACLGLCLGAGGIWVRFKSEKTVKDILNEKEELGSKCDGFVEIREVQNSVNGVRDITPYCLVRN